MDLGKMRKMEIFMEGHEKKYNNIFINHRDIMGIGTYL